jgi:chaperonin GroEL (HSP60 family)
MRTVAVRTMSAPPEPPRERIGTGRKPAAFDLLTHNLGMAAALEEFLAPAYGPGGRAKLFLDPKGRPVPTTDGARMLALLGSPHPVGKVVAGVAAAQDEQWRDGTKLAALFALRLLRRAGPLLTQGVRPARIVQGYEIGLARATQAVSNLAETRDPFEEGLLLGVARGSLGGWLEARPREELAREIVTAARQVAVPVGGGWRCDRRDIHVFAKGRGGFAVQRIDGYVLNRSRDDPTMPSRVEDARIALLDAAPIRGKAGIHAPRLRWIGDTTIQLKSPSEAEAYGATGESYTEEIVTGLERSGATVVLCTLGISDYGHKLLAKAGILGIRRIMKTSYMDDVARATGASLIKDFRQVGPDVLGRAGLVEEREIGGSKFLILDRCPNPRVVSLLISGPGDAGAEQYEAQARKAVAGVAAVIEDPRVVPGGGGAEMATSVRVRREANGIEGREQLAVDAFGRALEDIVACLAANLGLNPRDAVLSLRAACAGGVVAGFLAGARDPVDAAQGLLWEPLAPRVDAWGRAVEAARAVLRADDFHKVSRRSRQKSETGDEAKDSASSGSGMA